MSTESPLTVAVLNTNDDVVELLRMLFEQQPYDLDRIARAVGAAIGRKH